MEQQFSIVRDGSNRMYGHCAAVTGENTFQYSMHIQSNVNLLYELQHCTSGGVFCLNQSWRFDFFLSTDLWRMEVNIFLLREIMVQNLEVSHFLPKLSHCHTLINMYVYLLGQL